MTTDPSTDPIWFQPPPRPSAVPAAPERPARARVALSVDGREVEVPEGSTLLDACRASGVDVPTLCFLETLTPVNACRVCVVEVEGARTLAPACSRQAEPGMKVHTGSERVRLSRKLVLELLNPTYDATGQLLIYEANILGEYAGEVLAPVADRQQDQELASEFDHASLFIDDCADWTIACRDTHCNVVGDLGSHGMCWNWDAFECQPCGSSWAAMAQACNANFSDCQGQCNTATCGGMVL